MVVSRKREEKKAVMKYCDVYDVYACCLAAYQTVEIGLWKC
jgi:hypothetical protein